jgi:eukaryotic-like serine/threonine-protein kinase
MYHFSMPEDFDFIALQSALAGQYSLEKELGRGGMGVVYLAREVQLERPVAIKVLPPSLGGRADLRERFLREARTAAKLSHPNIVPIFRVDEIGGFVFFAMGYVEGETLTQRVRARGPLPPQAATRLLQEIAWALAYAHARGVVHRDIKPDNILIESEGGRALVTDFGIARVEAASGLTEVGQVMGTAHFMSPEQAAGESIDGRSDLYALGVVAHFALTGKLPFDGPTVQSILAKHLTQLPPPLASVSASVPKDLARAIDRCLAKEPAARYATGEALADALTAAQGQRRETPAPVRVWLQKGEAFKWAYPFWYLTFGLSAIFEPSFPGSLCKLLLPPVVHGGFELYQTRRLFQAGYDRETLVQALREHVEQRREELAFEFGQRPALLWRVIRWLTYASLGVAVSATALVVLGIDVPLPIKGLPPAYGAYVVLVLSSMATMTGTFIGLYNPGRVVKRQDNLAVMRLRLWTSKLGKKLAAFAGWKLRPGAGSAQLVNRPTEVAIGLAAADLFAALPKETQKRLRELPDAVKRLEDEARTMRKRVDDLNGKLADAGTSAAAPASAVLGQYGGDDAVARQRESVAAELAAMRDAAGRRLAITVAALENIRLDLLRLQAGAGSVESLTTALEAARRVGDEVDATVAGRSLAGTAPATDAR